MFSTITEKLTPPAGTADGARPGWQVFLLIAVVTFAAYSSAVHGGFIWDDDFHVFNNPNLKDLAGLWRIWFTTENQQYYPLVYSSFWVEYRLWGATPEGYHLVNILLHSINAFLVYRVLRYLGAPGAMLAGLVFALHPVHVESVAWISERKNVLSGMFYLTAMFAYLRFDDDGDKRLYALSLALFLCALWSKTVTSTLPVALLLLIWMRGRMPGVRDFKRLAPFFAVGLVMGLVTVFWEVKFVGARGEEFALPITERFLLPGRVAWFYAGKIVAPLDLIFFYERWELDTGALWQWAFDAALVLVLAVLFFLKGAVGRKPFAAVFFFVLTLFPALGFFNVYPFRFSFVADHFQYLASIGVIAFVSGVVTVVFRTLFPEGGAGRVARVVAAAALLGVLGLLTFNQGKVYADLETLYEDTIEKNPEAWLAHNNLGNVYAYTGRNRLAIEHYRRAIEIKPDFRLPYYNTGNELSKLGMTERANDYYRKAIEVEPDYAEAHFNLANNLSAMGDYPGAVDHYAQAVETDPEDADMRVNYGNNFVRMGRLEDALEQYRKALETDPGNEAAKKNMEYVRRRLSSPGGQPR